MMTWSKTSLAIALSTLAFGAGVMSGYPQAKVLPGGDPAPVTSGGAGVIEGKVVEVEPLGLVIEKPDGETVRVPMPGKTGEAASTFSKGDYIEATVTPRGNTTSVRTVVNPEKHEMINPDIR
jgi:hypothetical protein